MNPPAVETLVTGLAFPEGARWHDGALWFSDTHACAVLRLDPASGETATVAEVPGRPSGLGFLPDGRLLISSTHDRRLLRREPDGTLVEHADLSAIAAWHVNDMVVDGRGRAYVGNYGDASAPPDPPRPATLALVQPDGTASAAAEGMLFANGLVLSGDGATLVVAETRASPGRLTAFDVDPADGSLSGRRTLAEFDAAVFPDGLAIDAQDGVWVASPFSAEVIRVDRGGAITDRLAVADPYAVALGGADGRDLFVCTSGSWLPEQAARERSGAIRRLRVTVPAA
ncbi:SMP-30/gluconolactonase/LRE family protein [Conexibacter sp. JD483]|uniref:SMP-30/gluconolactonase/LRE family protein n=1 Tax=unclassified Conexibacter TaxID=2627773 RepID=UPI00272744CB|nr:MULTISPECIES: SMP-30/gluconolactonase/LRE family protein [unclassified Conexibacter]MDO8186809.1 SMP-30/gluconolactonase/LRE family protein [Conexibacter sp. CPCC 205706]MDO8197437.1 SMP-30/gluconolactonase/LRE family protein [Conexibacter sp. CPCC 205762]MDR9370452.1 SMP-30/gluconolactonase/LRE family protein [Conexibacter sp. JD483]